MPFPHDKNHKAFVCRHVFNASKPILFVCRPNGEWIFLCGAAHPKGESIFRVVGLGHVIEIDPTLQALADLPPDWDAERRAVGKRWTRTPYYPSKR